MVTLIASALMGITFVISLKLNFFSFVDSVWALSFTFIVLAFALYSWNFDQHFVFYAMVAIWSLRLFWYTFFRVLSDYPREDSRYTELKKKWQGKTTSQFALFFGAQAATIIVLATPAVLVASHLDEYFHPVSKFAVLLWMLGIIGEAIADAQLRAFKANPKNYKRVCDVGLWRMSRHPNYFFEWVIWISFAVYALAVPFGYLGLVAPALIYYLLNHVSGIPLSEAQAFRSKGILYEEYQQRTSRFFLWFPKNNRK